MLLAEINYQAIWEFLLKLCSRRLRGWLGGYHTTTGPEFIPVHKEKPGIASRIHSQPQLWGGRDKQRSGSLLASQPRSIFKLQVQ